MSNKQVRSYSLDTNIINQIELISNITGKNLSLDINTNQEMYIPQYITDIEENYIEQQAISIKSRSILTDYSNYSSTSSLFGKRITNRDNKE